jgi:hypothetical protein
MNVLDRAKKLFCDIEEEISNVIDLKADYKSEIDNVSGEEDILDEFIFCEISDLQKDLDDLNEIHQKLIELRNKVTGCLIS